MRQLKNPTCPGLDVSLEQTEFCEVQLAHMLHIMRLKWKSAPPLKNKTANLDSVGSFELLYLQKILSQIDSFKDASCTFILRLTIPVKMKLQRISSLVSGDHFLLLPKPRRLFAPNPAKCAARVPPRWGIHLWKQPKVDGPLSPDFGPLRRLIRT